MHGGVSLLQFFIENQSYQAFIDYITSIHMTNAEAEICFSTLKRIKTFLRSTMSQDQDSTIRTHERHFIQIGL